MSYAIDTNILLYASDQSGQFNPQAMAFLSSCASNPELLCLPWPVLMGYLRIATHPAIFSTPLDPGEAMANLDALLSLPQARVLSEQEGFWQTYREVAGDLVVRGNLVPDAHVAALLRQHGVDTLWTHDRDFLKFRFLRIKDPFA